MFATTEYFLVVGNSECNQFSLKVDYLYTTPEMEYNLQVYCHCFWFFSFISMVLYSTDNLINVVFLYIGAQEFFVNMVLT